MRGLRLHCDGTNTQGLVVKQSDEALEAKIANNDCHSGGALLSQPAIEVRDFPEYKMSFKHTQPRILEASIPEFRHQIDRRHIPEAGLEELYIPAAFVIKTFAKSTRLGTN
ncbi:MAG: hypothetical protein ACON4O_08375 [Lentimonas sp.]